MATMRALLLFLLFNCLVSAYLSQCTWWCCNFESTSHSWLGLEAQLSTCVSKLLISIERLLLINIFCSITYLIESWTISRAHILEGQTRIVETMLRWHRSVVLMQWTKIWSTHIFCCWIFLLLLVELWNVDKTTITIGVVSYGLLMINLSSFL